MERLRPGRRARLRAAELALAAAVAVPAGAQTTAIPACVDTVRLAAVDFATSDRDLARVLQLAGALPTAPAVLRRAGTEHEQRFCPDAARFLKWALEDAPAARRQPFVHLLPVTLEMESNSAYRRDRNNGALRGGVGSSVALGAGVEFRWKGITAALAPRFVHESNGDFSTVAVVRPGYSPFVYPYEQNGYLIDFPQRFGTGADTRVEPGQSYLRIGTRHFEAGASTENFWLGSAQVYPILVSSTAPGFPHLFLGTVEPLDLWIAQVGVHAVLGRLSESDFFDTADDNDARLFSAAVVEATLRWIPGLHLGVARVIEEVVPPEGHSLDDYLGSLLDPSLTFAGGGNPVGNGIGALLARWVLPAAGFEAYAEWSRDDTPYNLRDLLEEPDWTQAYTLGFHQLVTLESLRLRWYGELVHLGEAAPVRAGKGFASYYTHNRTLQGHTNEGQILGASPGPGSDAQIFGVDGFHAWGSSGLWLERTRYDEDTYYRRWARFYGESRHDVELGIGLRHAMALGPLRVGGEFLYDRRANRAFLGLEDRAMPRQVDTNLALRLRVAWHP